LSATLLGSFDVDHIEKAARKRLAEKMVYVRGDLTKPELYDKLRSTLEEADKAHGPGQRYLLSGGRRSAVWFRGGAARQRELTDQAEDENGKHRFWRRAVIEKPFGHSLDSARELNAQIQHTLPLGKDTVKNFAKLPKLLRFIQEDKGRPNRRP
jgi:glucose-6-phosphate 1-dehydrogenase